MKKLLLGIGFILLGVAGFAQDVIIRYDGCELLGKVMAITSSHVKYKDLATDTICEENRAEVFLIRYEDGQEVIVNDIVGTEEAMQEKREETGDLNNSSSDLFGTTLRSSNRSMSVFAAMKKVGAAGAYPLYLLGRTHQVIGGVVMASGVAIAVGASVMDAIEEGAGFVFYVVSAGVGLVGFGIHAIGEWLVGSSFTIYQSKQSEYLHYNNNLNTTTLSYGLAPHGLGFTLRF